MTALLVLGGCCLVLLSALATWVVSDSTVGHLLRTRVHRVVVITTKTGSAFRGTLTQVDRHVLVLRGAEALGQGEDGTHLVVDGELIVQRSEIDYLQLP